MKDIDDFALLQQGQSTHSQKTGSRWPDLPNFRDAQWSENCQKNCKENSNLLFRKYHLAEFACKSLCLEDMQFYKTAPRFTGFLFTLKETRLKDNFETNLGRITTYVERLDFRDRLD